MLQSRLMSTFTDLKVRKSLVDTIAQKEITIATAVQEQVIPAVFEGKNLIFSSETGTGKTYAFLLPLLTKLLEEREAEIAANRQPTPQPRILIVAPTHELGSQIKQEVEFLAKAKEDAANDKLKLKTMLCIGGASITRQIETLKEKPQIIIGGSARLLELIHLKKLKTQQVFAIVLDEVDRLLSPELRDITTELLKTVDCDPQIIACSATIKQSQLKILQEASNKTLENIIMPKEDVLKHNISHYALHAEKRDKIDTLRSLIQAEKPERALVFSAETGQIANIVSKLQYKKINCMGLHAKTDKIERKKAIDDFRSGKCQILVTSDLAARGLDIGNVTHIIQMDVPSNEDFFVHRAGRTARAGKSGLNIIIGDEYELRQLSKLEKKLEIVIYPKLLYGGKLIAPPQNNEEAEELRIDFEKSQTKHSKKQDFTAKQKQSSSHFERHGNSAKSRTNHKQRETDKTAENKSARKQNSKETTKSFGKAKSSPRKSNKVSDKPKRY